MFYALSENINNLREKINFFVALAPICKIGADNEWGYNLFAKTVPTLKKLTDNLKIHEWFGTNWESVHQKLSVILPKKVHHNSLKL